MRRHQLIRRLALLGSAVLVGCATPPAPLYSWEGFPRNQYDTLLREGKSPLEQISAMEAHAERARVRGMTLPPGFRAHLAMLHLTVGNMDEARRLLELEKAMFPESSAYMDQLLKRFQSQERKNTENPA
jgi:hypothetical protein